MEGGGVELINARWRSEKNALSSFIQVTNGHLTCRNCDLGNLGEDGASQPIVIDCRSLRAPGLLFKDSVFASRKTVLSLNMVNSAVRLENCLLFSLADGIQIAENSRGGIRLNHCTLSTGANAFRIPPRPTGLKIFLQDTVFGLTPRNEKTEGRAPTVVAYSGDAPKALEWWEESCAYNTGWAFRAVDQKEPQKNMNTEDWTDLWGAGRIQHIAHGNTAVFQKPLPNFSAISPPTPGAFRLTGDCDALTWAESGEAIGINAETTGPRRPAKAAPVAKDPPKGTPPKGPTTPPGAPKPSLF